MWKSTTQAIGKISLAAFSRYAQHHSSFRVLLSSFVFLHLKFLWLLPGETPMPMGTLFCLVKDAQT